MAIANLLKISLKSKIYLSILFFALIIFILVYLIVLPTVREIKKIGEDIEFQRADLDNKYIKGQNLKKLSENLKNIEPRLEKLNQFFINENRELEFITSLEDKASANDVAQKVNLGNASAVEGGLFKKSPLQLLTQGNFNNLFDYLINVENLNYYVNIKSLEFSLIGPRKDGSADKNINMFLTAETFWK